MKLQTNVGQVYLTHPKDKNYAELFEGAFSKHGKKVQLFVVIEVENEGKKLTSEKKQEYEKLAQTMVSSFKTAFVTAETLNEETFAQALSSVNTALSKLAGKDKVSWFGNLHVILGAFYDNRLFLSVTGKGYAYLLRDGELNLLIEEEEQEIKPVKIFSTYTTGGLIKDDRLLLATNQLFNYLSLERISAFMQEELLQDVCEELVEQLKETQDAGFAVFLIESGYPSDQAVPPEESITPPRRESRPGLIALEKIKSKKNIYFVAVLLYSLLKRLLSFIWRGITYLFSLFRSRQSRLKLSSVLKKPPINRKKLISVAVIIALIVLGVSIALAAVKKSADRKKADLEQVLSQAEQKLNDAEGALIYQDEAQATTLLTEADQLLTEADEHSQNEAYQELLDRLEELKQKAQKQTPVKPTVLATLPNIPTELAFSPNGLLGHNQNTGSLAFYDFRTGEVRSLLTNKNTNNLWLADYAGGPHGFVFVGRNGNFSRLNVSTESLSGYENEISPIPNISSRNLKDLFVFGTGSSARLYVLDETNNQILRMNLDDNQIGQADAWIQSGPADLANSQNLAIDGSIYVLFPDHLEEYFNGQRQNFALAPLLPEIKNATKVFTAPELDSIYILDPDNKRILVFDKTGQLVNQLTSDQFGQMSDLYVTSDGEIAYVLSGDRILQVDLE